MATVTPIGPGAYRVEDDGKQVVVFVAGSAGDVWAFCNGEIYRAREERDDATRGRPSSRPAEAGRYELTSPMPATVKSVVCVSIPTSRKCRLTDSHAPRAVMPIALWS